MRDFPGTLEVVQLTAVMGICGGTASGLAIPALLVARDVIRQHATGANIRVHVHALNHTCFEAVVSDCLQMEKLKANAAGFYREIARAMDPNRLQSLCDSLGIPIPDRPLLDAYVEYHSTDLRGRSYERPECLFESLRKNTLAEMNESVAAAIVDRDGCNLKMAAAALPAR